MIKDRLNKKIAIVDYGVGNLYSLKKAFENFSNNVVITEELEEVNSSDALVLPGVGSFRAGIEGLRIRNLIKTIKEFSNSGRPILGICLGAQLLLNKGYEFGTFNGLNIIPGKVIRFPKIKDKIPHVGWNEIARPAKTTWNKTILDSLDNNPDLYFVHSYILKPNRKEHVLSLSKYGGYSFCSVVKKNKIFGCQFHPEKSGKVGLKIIKNFVNII